MTIRPNQGGSPERVKPARRKVAPADAPMVGVSPLPGQRPLVLAGLACRPGRRGLVVYAGYRGADIPGSLTTQSVTGASPTAVFLDPDTIESLSRSYVGVLTQIRPELRKLGMTRPGVDAKTKSPLALW